MFEDLRNRLDFFLRNNTRFSRRNFVEKNPKLIERNYLENLYTEDVLRKYFKPKFKSELNVLDIGCKNWFYAKGEYSFFEKFCKNIHLDGVELDAHRLYSNFYSRMEVAKYYTKGLENVKYFSGNLLDITQKYDYIVWFLPFVVLQPHVYWGLPKKYFYPQKLLNHAYSLMKKEGQMLIVNQGEAEALVQKQFLEELGCFFEDLGEIYSEHFEYKNKRYGFLVTKL